MTALLAFLLFASSAGAQRTWDPALMLARTCVSERNWRTDTNDCAAIYEVALSYQERRGGSLSHALWSLSRRLHGSRPVERRWLQFLRRSDAEPLHWPRERVSWSERRNAWLDTLEEARSLVAGSGPVVCAETPMAWGNDLDIRIRRRLLHRRWHEVDCGETVNHFGWWYR